MRQPVTTDKQVIAALLKQKKSLDATGVAKLFGLTPFQITARLKSLEKRTLLQRDKAGKWLVVRGDRTDAFLKAPEEVRHVGTSRAKAFVGPDDSQVPRIKGAGKSRGWFYIWRGTHTLNANGDPVDCDKGGDIFVGPDNRHWIMAKPDEPAHLIIEYEQRGIDPVRLVEFETTHYADTYPITEKEQKALDALRTQWLLAHPTAKPAKEKEKKSKAKAYTMLDLKAKPVKKAKPTKKVTPAKKGARHAKARHKR
jgi:hypothetical protein